MSTIAQETAKTEKETHHHSWTRYLFVYLGLILLTFSTFFVSRALKDVQPAWLHYAAALLIAFVKVGLVVAFFMHLAEAEGANRLVFFVSVLFVGVLMFFVLSDISHRFRLVNPQPQWLLQPEWRSEANHAGPGAQGFTGTTIQHHE